jgi:hypothetical protein
MRRTLSLLGALAMVLFLAGPAAADPPEHVRVTDPVSFVLPADVFCPGFEVEITYDQNYPMTFFGRETGWGFTALAGGFLRASATNLTSGETIDLNIPGPGFFDDSGIPIVGTGPWLIFLPGDPGSIEFVVGHIEFVETDFGVEIGTVRGKSQDLCAALAS